MRQTTARNAPLQRGGAAAGSTHPTAMQTAWIARDDPAAPSRLVLFGLAQYPFGVLEVIHGELTGLDQMRHDRPGAAEDGKEFIGQAPLYRLAGNHGFKNIGVADLAGSPYRALGFQAIDHGLHRRIGETFALGQMLLDLADRQP